jgi:SAM-dependent methyltransferase
MNCPLCKNSDIFQFCRDKKREYYRCKICFLVFVPDKYLPSFEIEKAEYDLHENSPHDMGYRKFLSRLFLPLNSKLPRPQKGLDFGSGPGPTLSVMFTEAGHNMQIFDPFYANDPQVLEKKYDFITATEVLEHIYNPAEVLKKIFSILKTNGKLGLMTKMVTNQEAFSNWHYKNDITHVRFYSKPTFQWLAKKYNLNAEFIEKDVIILSK